MLGAACDGSLLARPKSGIAPRLPQVAPSNPPLATDPCLRPPTRFTTHQSLLTTRAFLIRTAKLLEFKLTRSQETRKHFLIRTIRSTFTSVPLLTHHVPLITHHSPPTTRHCISNRYSSSRLEIALTSSQQTRKHFLIGTICPTLFFAPLLILRLSLNTHRSLTSFLFATNGIHKIIVPMKTKDKPRSIRYKFALRGIGLPGFAAHHSLPAPQQSLLTNSTSALDSIHPALLIVGRTSIQERP
jgi:hypothetical protein